MSLRRILVILASITILSSTWVASSKADFVTLVWTAPGEDSLTGRAARYDLRYSAQMITPRTFLQATEAPGMPLPATPGTIQSYVLDGLPPGAVCYLAIKTVDQAGNWSAMSNVIARMPREGVGQPATTGLAFSVPRPNPARDLSRFDCTLPEVAQVRVEVFDLLGRRVRLLVDESYGPGPRELVFDLRDDRGVRLAAGIYLVRAHLGSTAFTRRLVVLP